MEIVSTIMYMQSYSTNTVVVVSICSNAYGDGQVGRR